MLETVKNLVIAAAFAGVGYRFYINQPVPIDTAIASTVQLEDYCSGTIINDPNLSDGEQFTVITAKHCLAKDQKIGTVLSVNIAEDIDNKFTKMKEIKVIVKDISLVSDLILLQGFKQGEGLELPKANIYKGDVKIGDEVLSVSYPFGLSKLITNGYLGYLFTFPAFKDVSKDFLYQLSTTQAAGGSSGSGLFKAGNNEYELIGVLTGGIAYITAYTPLEEIREFLNSQKKVT